MANATVAEGSPAPVPVDATRATIRPEEAAHFAALAAAWWDPKGSSAMLHRLNPVRLAYLREAIDHHWSLDSAERRPLAGKRALDVGCGAGLLAEPLARLGADVTGIDAAAETVAAARAHAAGAGLSIAYRQGDIAELRPDGFDLVTAMEVLEHVADRQAFVSALAGALAPEGLLVLSTPNRTARARLLLVGAAEAVGAVPRGTHRWTEFVTPDELRVLFARAGLTMGEPRGIAWSPTAGLHLSDNLSLNYIVTATKGAPRAP
jgi:2-polyprenyl-6-hydroxyphenyl methylase / 3-demethylubiquinone-9 3-methyltransferase